MDWLTSIISSLLRLVGIIEQNNTDAVRLPEPVLSLSPTASINQEGFNLITSFEGCKLNSYQDQRGIWTIGYGHTDPTIASGQSINQATAFLLLKKDLAFFELGVRKAVTTNINGNQFSALVSFAYNAGLGSLKASTLLAKLNGGDFQGASEQFLDWDHIRVKGVLEVDPGLLRRRTAEQTLFLAPGNGTAIKWA